MKSALFCTGNLLLAVTGAPACLIRKQLCNSNIGLFHYVHSFGLSFGCLDFDIIKFVVSPTLVHRISNNIS